MFLFRKFIDFFLYVLVVFFSSFSSIAQENDESVFRFELGENAYLLGDSIHLREQASSSSKSIIQLPIGSKVKLLKRSKTISELNGFKMAWYYVEYAKNKAGYVWGGKLALASFRSTKNTDIVFHFGFDRQTSEKGFYQIRVEKNNKELQRISFEGFGTFRKMHEFQNLGNKGLENVDDVICVKGYGQACGDIGGEIVFFWSKEKLHKIKMLLSVGDPLYFSTNYFVYPSDIEGEKGLILLKEESGHYSEKEDNLELSNEIIYEKRQTTNYVWDGKQLVKKN